MVSERKRAAGGRRSAPGFSPGLADPGAEHRPRPPRNPDGLFNGPGFQDAALERRGFAGRLHPGSRYWRVDAAPETPSPREATAMTSAQRSRINRQNAQKSTGPTTPEGKDRSRRNSLKHGLRAEAFTLPHEDPVDIRARAPRNGTSTTGRATPPSAPSSSRPLWRACECSRCARFEQSALSLQVRIADEEWKEAHVAEVERPQGTSGDRTGDRRRRPGPVAQRLPTGWAKSWMRS